MPLKSEDLGYRYDRVRCLGLVFKALNQLSCIELRWRKPAGCHTH